MAKVTLGSFEVKAAPVLPAESISLPAVVSVDLLSPVKKELEMHKEIVMKIAKSLSAVDLKFEQKLQDLEQKHVQKVVSVRDDLDKMASKVMADAEFMKEMAEVQKKMTEELKKHVQSIQPVETKVIQMVKNTGDKELKELENTVRNAVDNISLRLNDEVVGLKASLAKQTKLNLGLVIGLILTLLEKLL